MNAAEGLLGLDAAGRHFAVARLGPGRLALGLVLHRVHRDGRRALVLASGSKDQSVFISIDT